MAQKVRESAEHYAHELKELSSRWWGVTQKTVSTAGAKAGEYKRLVRKKLDLTTIQRKIDARYTDLGKRVFLAWEAEDVDPFGREETREVLEALRELKKREQEIAREVPADPTESREARAEEEEELHL